MGIKGNYIESILSNRVKGNKLSEVQLETLRAYDRASKLGGKLKESSRANNLSYLRSFGLFVKKPWDKVTRKDVENFIERQIEERSESSVNSWKGILKQFYTWMNKGKAPNSVSWLEVSRTRKRLTPSDLLTRKEIMKMIEACDTPRDRCLVALLYESAARAAELMSVNLEDVEFDVYGAKVFLRESKTRTRSVRCIDSTPYLRDWMNNHPLKEKENAPLFPGQSKNKYGTRLSPISLGYMIKKIGKRGGVKKKIYPHLLRHSRLTELLKTGLNETELKQFAGWTENSSMISTYVHLGSKDVDDKILKINGIKTAEEIKEVNVLQKKLCPFCDSENKSSDVICSACSRPIDFKEAVRLIQSREKYDKLIDILVGDKKIRERIQELQAKG